MEEQKSKKLESWMSLDDGVEWQTREMSLDRISNLAWEPYGSPVFDPAPHLASEGVPCRLGYESRG